MKKITVEDILKVTKGKLITGDNQTECENVLTDTRKIQKGDTFVGIKGENFNGNELWEKAVEAGAKIVIVQGIDFSKYIDKYSNVSIILVEDTIKALGQIAKYKRSLYNIPIIAITGSVGKTSTKDIIANVVSQKYKTLKTEGNFNNHLGVPLTLLGLRDHEVAVIEMGMNHEGELRYLTNIANPTISVVTNIGTSHIGNLGSRENILKAKMEILEGMENKKLVTNNDNDLLHKYYEDNKNKIEIKTFGIKNESDVMAKDIKLNKNNSEFKYKDKTIKVPIGGEHFVYNALCATAVGETLDIDLEKIKHGIESFELTQKRMEITTLSTGTQIINDSYNASYESMKASLKYLATFDKKRKIAVLGDMLELGEFSKELHKKVGEEVAKNKIDLLICIGEEAKNIVEGAKETGMKEDEIHHFENQEKALLFLKDKMTQDDIILFKASNGMKFYNMVEKLIKNLY